jgi:hypothetical protein
VIQHRFTDVSEELTASSIRVEDMPSDKEDTGIILSIPALKEWPPLESYNFKFRNI